MPMFMEALENCWPSAHDSKSWLTGHPASSSEEMVCSRAGSYKEMVPAFHMQNVTVKITFSMPFLSFCAAATQLARQEASLHSGKKVKALSPLGLYCLWCRTTKMDDNWKHCTRNFLSYFQLYGLASDKGTASLSDRQQTIAAPIMP